MSLRLTSLALAILLTGCSTLETAANHTRDFAARHPVATAVAGVIVVGGAIAALDHHGDHLVPLAPHGRTSPCSPQGVTDCSP